MDYGLKAGEVQTPLVHHRQLKVPTAMGKHKAVEELRPSATVLAKESKGLEKATGDSPLAIAPGEEAIPEDEVNVGNLHA